MKRRQLTVSTLFRPAPAPRRKEGTVPHLRLSGRWLAAAGFPAGARVNVTLAAAGRITVEVAR